MCCGNDRSFKLQHQAGDWTCPLHWLHLCSWILSPLCHGGNSKPWTFWPDLDTPTGRTWSLPALQFGFFLCPKLHLPPSLLQMLKPNKQLFPQHLLLENWTCDRRWGLYCYRRMYALVFTFWETWFWLMSTSRYGGGGSWWSRLFCKGWYFLILTVSNGSVVWFFVAGPGRASSEAPLGEVGFLGHFSRARISQNWAESHLWSFFFWGGGGSVFVLCNFPSLFPVSSSFCKVCVILICHFNMGWVIFK